MPRRLTVRDLNAITDALTTCLAGEWEDGDGEGGAPREDLEAALDKVLERLPPAAADMSKMEA